jgi:hypothetical protein
MSDLTDKFGAVGTQLTTQHDEIMNALDTIATALGAPPPGPTTTLENVVTAITASNTLLTGIRADMNGYLLDIFNTLDTINTNASLNTQRLLIAIAANDPCRDCTTTPISPPPLDVTPQTVDNEHCKRMQALIYALRRFTVKLDLLSSFGLGFSPTVISDAIAEIMTELGVSELLEFPSLGEVAQLAGAGAAYIVSNIFSSTSLPTEFLSIEDALLPVLYAADNAADGQAAYRSLLAGSTLDSRVQLLFSAMAYTSIFNLYYDSTIELDLSGYDGTICSSTDCFIQDAVGITFQDNSTNTAIVWDAPFSGQNHTPAGYYANNTVWGLTSPQGWTITPTQDVKVFNQWDSSPIVVAANTPFTFTGEEPDYPAIIANVANTPFSVEFCPPEPS